MPEARRIQRSANRSCAARCSRCTRSPPALFQSNLRIPGRRQAREYLAKRGVTPEQIERVRPGSLRRFLGPISAPLSRKSSFRPSNWSKAAWLCRRQEGGGFYDRFRGRLMFPIHNESGKVIGFGGRALKPGDEPKYLNSPETPIYRKSYVLYNLHRAKDAIRKADRAVLVEGYMDVIGVYSAGVHEVVASCGTALDQHAGARPETPLARTSW